MLLKTCISEYRYTVKMVNRSDSDEIITLSATDLSVALLQISAIKKIAEIRICDHVGEYIYLEKLESAPQRLLTMTIW